MIINLRVPKKNELTKKGFTNRIQISSKQTKQSLLNVGFTNRNKRYLYYAEKVDEDISFNLSVDAATLQIVNLDVLNEELLQPYDYQKQILLGNPSQKAITVYQQINEILLKLQKQDIIMGFEEGMYV